MALPSPSTIESPYLRSLIAGGLAGTTVDLSLYPIDTLKTRLQSSAGFHSSGGFRGIYAGVGSALIGSAPGAALFFVTYEGTKKWLLEDHQRHAGALGGVGDKSREPLVQMLAASLGEVAACAVRVPTEVIKQRAQARQFSGSWSALVDILQQRRTQGLGYVGRELYRGWSVTVLREVPFTVIQFPLWEALKAWRKRSLPPQGLGDVAVGVNGEKQISALESGIFGSVSGAVAAAVTTPLDVLKTRMMLSREPTRMMPLLGKILRESGVRAFFAGIGPRVVWISAGGAIFLGSYQWAWNSLGGGS
ncbi:MAG: S-adenosylmethionine transporter [Bogoriella megaspora]|nr:MAG: S-adenosylmethionine transporter [Bogoriella megaspora]